MSQKGLLSFGLEHGLLYEHDDGTRVLASRPGSVLQLSAGHTHFGVVISGSALVKTRHRARNLEAGDYFSVRGPAMVSGDGRTAIISIKGYAGLDMCGGPIEETGRLRYINGSTDTILVPPVRRGDPCMNFLHFPPGVVQTPHTHPTIRVNFVLRGEGACVLPEEGRRVPLVPGYAFVILADTVHGFESEDDAFDVITFHPVTDAGMTDDDHPMVNMTMVNGVSASGIPEIRTREQKEERS